MARAAPQYICRECGAAHRKWSGQCGDCGAWNSIEEMRSVVQEAEEPEPLLARELYETVREAERDDVSQSLDDVQQLLELGVTESIPEPLEEANAGVSRLRENVEVAAESVLGDETEGLRRALSELDELADQISREIARGAGRNEPPSDQEGQAGSPTPRSGDPQAERDETEEAPGERQGDPSPSESDSPSGNQPSPSNATQPGESQSSESPPNESQSGSQSSGGGEQPGEQPSESESQSPNGGGGQPPGESSREQQGGGAFGGDLDRMLDAFRRGGGGPGGPRAPLTGDDFREFRDRMLNVQEMLDDPELRGDAELVLDRAEQERRELQRHSSEPDWTKLQEMVADPLVELVGRVEAELRRRESPDSLTPIDRDDPPPELADLVRKYYERLGSGE